MADLRVIFPAIAVVSIIIIIILIVFRRAAFRNGGVRVRRVHHPHNSCATYVVPGCETIRACPTATYPQAYPNQPMYYQPQNPIPPQQLYPQAPPYPPQQPPYPNEGPSSPTTSHPNPPQFSSPPPYYSAEAPKI